MTTDNREAIKALVAKWRADAKRYGAAYAECANELEALLTTEPPAEGGVAEGWKLVPVEPTAAMLDSGALDKSWENMRHWWAGMLAAAPEAPAFTAAGAAQGGGDREALLRQMEALEAEWCEASAGKPSSRRIATYDTDRNTRGEDDFDNEVFARIRCASQLAMLIARARSSTPTPAAQSTDAVLALPEPLQIVIDKARRFIETTEDEGSFDIGRDWAGVLTMLGLLVRTQRSPAIWCTTSAIDDLIEWDSRRLATPTPAAQPSGEDLKALYIRHFGTENGWLDNTGSGFIEGYRLALSSTPAAVGGDAVGLIAAERLRQVSAEGWSAAHDDSYNKLELVRAAVAYALHGTKQNVVPDSFWPWHLDWWKPSDNVRNLVKAGALIAAEIDRLKRRAAIAAEQGDDNGTR